MHGRERRVLMTTEGTYPFVVGGVSSWCDLLVRGLPELHWQIFPIVAGGRPRRLLFELPANTELAGGVDLWSQELPAWRRAGRSGGAGLDLPGLLVRELCSWRAGEPGVLIEALVACRERPASVRRSFRSAQGWASFLAGLHAVLAERDEDAGRPPHLDLAEASVLYQALYWVARTAAVETPPSDVLHVTAAGWAAIPALVHKALHGTPIVLTEHGVYVREAYLGAARSGASPGARFVTTRLARGLARAAYAAADVVAPVTDANARWEEGLGVDPARIRVVYNGVDAPERVEPPPGTSTVVSVGRIDPLKDLHTMLRVAVEVLRRVPQAQFLHYGPVGEGQQIYGRSCLQLHERFGLGDRFRFMGRTSDPTGVVRAADIVLMTSISEALPLSVLEAMAEARPVVATAVGGVPDVVHGCGLVAPPGDVHGLALAVSTLLRQPELAAGLGERGAARVRRIFSKEACLNGYRELLGGPPLEAAA